ncbi:helix-turn-helix transcriptional regulator [Streptomyces albireticuli]|uniref:helix-turn-helix transcriptional regulator n=1 Tax=Streptomyces albireticuli TaxID=1940 RepID=UPI00117C64DD|nr:helix-turn-helix transcriptional regulator [Streptomyces albireticuli]MCD9145695.1 helix-turn-helix transcriptional regulator [Streptomyces albireticuli]MCD9165573.1 helix-turn-helix transcriptional regulator [Streptomyces albireticuli]MCD9195904.1 helix-turn-helix transcriptional regulator [Streptomyces albireticuli]
MGDVDGVARCLEAAVGERFVRDELAALVSQAVTPWVAHDGLRLFGMNPATGAVSFGFLHDFSPDLVQAQLHDAYLGDDPFSPADITRHPAPVALFGGSDGSNGNSRPTPGHRQVLSTLAAHGAGSEARLLLRDRHGAWGLLALLRESGGRPFDGEDAARLARLSPLLITLLRGYATAAPPPSGAHLPAGVAIVGADHQVRSLTPEARAWMREISPERGLAPRWMPQVSMREISLAARRHLADPGAPRPLACSPTAYLGRRVAVHAQPLDEHGEGDVAVLFQEATGTLLLSTFAAWHGLTARESLVLRHLYSGAAPKQIARGLEVSPHTVNAHVKAVFRKTGVSGRDELLAALDS